MFNLGYALPFTYGTQRFAHVLRSFKERVSVVTDPTVMSGTIEITVPPEDEGTYTRTFWLDPRKGYAIVRQEARYPDSLDPLLYVVDEYALQEAAPGIWYPMSARRRAGPNYVEEYRATVVRINDPAFPSDDRFFTLRFPAMLHVKDARTGEKSTWWMLNVRRTFRRLAAMLPPAAGSGVAVLLVFMRRRRRTVRAAPGPTQSAD